MSFLNMFNLSPLKAAEMVTHTEQLVRPFQEFPEACTTLPAPQLHINPAVSATACC